MWKYATIWLTIVVNSQTFQFLKCVEANKLSDGFRNKQVVRYKTCRSVILYCQGLLCNNWVSCLYLTGLDYRLCS